jgi:hypothetical protein
MQKLKLKSIYMLCRNFGSSHTKHNKIGFAIFGFFCDFTRFFKAAAKTQHRVKNLLSPHPLEVLNLHKTSLAFNT